jgi:sugar phosphate isomerase/epimerase
VLAATGPFHGRPLDEAFSAAAEAGYDGVELMVTTDRATQDPVEVNRLAARWGQPVRALHGPFLLLTRRVFGTDLRAKVRRSVDLAEAVGAPVVITHAPFRWEVPYMDWLPSEILRVREERGITVTVENMFPVQLRGLRVSFYAGTELEGMRQFHFLTLDTSHAAVAGVDPLQAWDLVGDQTVHIHAANNAGNGRDSHAPLEVGVVPVTRFLETLGANGFMGAVTLEINFRPLLGDRIQLVAAMRHELELARECLARGRRRAGAASA